MYRLGIFVFERVWCMCVRHVFFRRNVILPSSLNRLKFTLRMRAERHLNNRVLRRGDYQLLVYISLGILLLFLNGLN